ncbi:GntR family transcriptional regulator/MocR family aminotransferase [Nocardia sp. GAS34]|uniref:MocR-like pyridoxine biosynthesis transcription factor PdxR n=1 Tax=unclassified Nocardia TaxID=2637762 RepID=UPI003D1B42C5
MESWTGSASDLLLSWDRALGVRRGIEHALRHAVQCGTLRPGTALPSSRVLAADLGVARNTVAEVYAQLVAEGYLEARAGARTWVRALPPRAADPGDLDYDPTTNHDLTPGRADIGLFPRREWSRATAAALSTVPDAALSYGDPRGAVGLRRALASYLGRARGVVADPADILVCTGTTQAISLLAQLLSTGDSVAIEDPTLPSNRLTFERAGYHIHHLPVDAEGADTTRLRDTDAMALLTPAHQFPLGVALSAERRLAAVRWAERTGGTIVEDDYDGDLRFDQEPIGALQGLAPEHVVYIGTASKILAPGLRLAWMVVPRRLRHRLTEVKSFADRQSGVIDQLSLAHLIDTGALDRHRRKARNHYRARRAQLLETLDSLDTPVSGIAAGLHAVIDLGTLARERAALDAAQHNGLIIYPLGIFAHESRVRPALVAGYGTPPQHAYRHTLELLRKSLLA